VHISTTLHCRFTSVSVERILGVRRLVDDILSQCTLFSGIEWGSSHTSRCARRLSWQRITTKLYTSSVCSNAPRSLNARRLLCCHSLHQRAIPTTPWGTQAGAEPLTSPPTFTWLGFCTEFTLGLGLMVERSKVVSWVGMGRCVIYSFRFLSSWWVSCVRLHSIFSDEALQWQIQFHRSFPVWRLNTHIVPCFDLPFNV
jgi:hypothetical protein